MIAIREDDMSEEELLQWALDVLLTGFIPPMTSKELAQRHPNSEVVVCDDSLIHNCGFSVEAIADSLEEGSIIEHLGRESPYYLDNGAEFYLVKPKDDKPFHICLFEK